MLTDSDDSLEWWTISRFSLYICNESESKKKNQV